MTGIGITLDTAAVMSTAMEGILYGFSVLMFMGTLWTLTYKRRMKDINRRITVVAILLFILSTAHMVVDIIRLEQGLVTYRDTFPGGPVAFFADSTQPAFLLKNVIYIFQTIIGDGMMIYRCYVVWQSTWVIIPPIILLFGFTGCGFCAVYSSSQADSDAGNIFAKATAQWITAYYSMTLATNLWASGLLVYRIWMIEHNVSALRATKSITMPIVRIIVDAALLYSATLFTTLVCFVISENGQYILLDMIMPIISIAFYMVLTRIAINNRPHSYLPAIHEGINNETARENTRDYPMKPLQVHISQFTHNYSTLGYGTENRDQSSTKVECIEGESCPV
ncbi:hypothetical protein EDB19DRAFT_907456 [Suillus lakei]|nr:hypothetical protein EDB19DRAFT_907456 [Suillus lakei]